LLDTNIDYLQNINDFGPEVSQSIFDFFKDKKNIELINNLISLGINPVSSSADYVINDFFMNKKIVITGTFEDYSRSELTNLLENMRAKVSSAISSATDYLICGSESGSKLDKAISLGIRVIDEDELRKLL
jgi:DNA ligase (NAD+)